MPTYKYNIDQKSTIWQRHHYTVEANSQMEADNLMIHEMQLMQLPSSGAVQFMECETLFDTITEMQPADNDGEPTRELMNHAGDTIKTNA